MMSIVDTILGILVWIILITVAIVLAYIFVVFVAVLFTILAASFYLIFTSAGDILFHLPDLFREITQGG